MLYSQQSGQCCVWLGPELCVVMLRDDTYTGVSRLAVTQTITIHQRKALTIIFGFLDDFCQLNLFGAQLYVSNKKDFICFACVSDVHDCAMYSGRL